jgi:hypothetical protein
MEFLWNYMFNNPMKMDEEHANKALNSFIDIFKHSAYTYLTRIVENLKQGKLGYLNLKIAAAFLKESENKVFADILQEDFDLFDLLVEDLISYMARVKPLVAAKFEQAAKDKKTLGKTAIEDMSEEVYVDLFKHSE